MKITGKKVMVFMRIRGIIDWMPETYPTFSQLIFMSEMKFQPVGLFKTIFLSK
jgi:hypothetical protein